MSFMKNHGLLLSAFLISIFSCELDVVDDIDTSAENSENLLKNDESSLDVELEFHRSGPRVELARGAEVVLKPALLPIRDAKNNLVRAIISTPLVHVVVTDHAPIEITLKKGVGSKSSEYGFRLMYVDQQGETRLITPPGNKTNMFFTEIKYDRSNGRISGKAQRAAGYDPRDWETIEEQEYNHSVFDSSQIQAGIQNLYIEVLPTSNPGDWDCDGHRTILTTIPQAE